MKKSLLLLFVLFMAACGQSDFDVALQAYNAQEYESAFNKFSSLAKSGDGTAQSYLGLIYERGLGVEKDLSLIHI